ncbi:hypothetical protein [Pontibacter harenae]|uniref:hypothetical protein n=1 Tax=Pontibacter harenae TaxID=2894083 RepID=UPI001E527C7D|nr:hypothetical protein [Pontibacter harenae]MCC9166383.1 hypothetical protein [Pontibacter harenae]
MDRYPLKPEHMRAPDNLSRDEIKQSLDELDSKIKVLQGRANATTADSNHTYHQHIEALETKRSMIAQKLDIAEDDHSKWQDIKDGIDKLKTELEQLFK